jgi:hypothetical protein
VQFSGHFLSSLQKIITLLMGPLRFLISTCDVLVLTLTVINPVHFSVIKTIDSLGSLSKFVFFRSRSGD